MPACLNTNWAFFNETQCTFISGYVKRKFIERTVNCVWLWWLWRLCFCAICIVNENRDYKSIDDTTVQNAIGPYELCEYEWVNVCVCVQYSKYWPIRNLLVLKIRVSTILDLIRSKMVRSKFEQPHSSNSTNGGNDVGGGSSTTTFITHSLSHSQYTQRPYNTTSMPVGFSAAGSSVHRCSASFVHT